MAVIPARSVLHCSEPVRKAISGTDGALRNGIDPVHFEGLKLSDPMPMN